MRANSKSNPTVYPIKPERVTPETWSEMMEKADEVSSLDFEGKRTLTYSEPSQEDQRRTPGTRYLAFRVNLPLKNITNLPSKVKSFLKEKGLKSLILNGPNVGQFGQKQEIDQGKCLPLRNGSSIPQKEAQALEKSAQSAGKRKLMI